MFRDLRQIRVQAECCLGFHRYRVRRNKWLLVVDQADDAHPGDSCRAAGRSPHPKAHRSAPDHVDDANRIQESGAQLHEINILECVLITLLRSESGRRTSIDNEAR